MNNYNPKSSKIGRIWSDKYGTYIIAYKELSKRKNKERIKGIYRNPHENLPSGTWYDDDLERFMKFCPNCNWIQPYTRKNHLVTAHKNKIQCRICRTLQNLNISQKGETYKGIVRVAWFNKFKSMAVGRDIKWDITLEDIYKIAINTDKKCYYTGVDLNFGEKTNLKSITVSIDRINSNMPYLKDNIVLCHKRINMMKQELSIEKFQAWCLLVANKIQQDEMK